MTNANPFTHCLIPPATLKLPSGDSVSVPRCQCLFRPWQGKPIRDTYGGKTILEFDGKPVFAELAILGTLQRAGWDGVWVDTYRRKFRRSLPPDSCDLPSHERELYDRICRANGGRTSGCFDVFAWHKEKYLFIESKRESKDSIQATQKAWIDAALRSAVPLDALLICEWDLEPKGYDPDLLEDSKSMDEKPTNNKQDDNPYSQEEYERDMAHLDVVSAYQKRLSEQLGHPVTFGEAEDVAYGLFGSDESKIEELRKKYASAQSTAGQKPLAEENE
jgi:hypothetical protein